MFNKNLKYYRLRMNLTKKALAEKINVTPMAITHYEQGDRKPEIEILRKLADALGVKVSDFLATRGENLVFSHGDFRKQASLSVANQDLVRESTEEYFSRFMNIVEILGGEVLPAPPAVAMLDVVEDMEDNAHRLRKHLDLPLEGPVGNLTECLENQGILIYSYPSDHDQFSGLSGNINDRPYLVINQNMSPERNRSTMVHELAHIMFKWPDHFSQKEIESASTAISGAFLFPKTDIKRELGLHRRNLSQDMILVAREYGISIYLLIKRAEIVGIISPKVAKGFYIQLSTRGWQKNEPSRIEPEQSTLFEQLVYRAVSEEEISIQKGAELLKTSYDQVATLSFLDDGV